MDDKSLQRAPATVLSLGEQTAAKLVESLVLRGDISLLTPAQKATYYVQRCRQLGLDPASKPFAVLKLNGKEILYAEKGAADQLAKIHQVNRKITDGPKVIDLGGKKLVFVQCEASLPNGRCEMDVATVPLIDPDNVFMKCVSKAKRRATLSILGLGMLDEMELETIPAHAQSEGTPVDLSLAGESGGRTTELAADESDAAEPSDALVFFLARVAEIDLPGEAVAVWMKYRANLAPMSAADREGAWRALCKHTETVGKMKNAKVWLKKAIAEEDARRGVGQWDGPDNDPPSGPSGPNGGTRRPRSATSTDACGSAQESHGSGDASASVTTLPGVPEWATTPGGIRAHLAGLDHVRHLENSARLHGARLGAAYTEPAAERLIALDGPDAHGSHLALSTARGMVTAWAEAGPRPKAETRKSGVGR